jgi:hypothetical protein
MRQVNLMASSDFLPSPQILVCGWRKFTILNVVY